MPIEQPEQFSIFLSYKSQDKAMAIELKKILRVPCGDSLQVHMMEEIKPGAEWLKWIGETLPGSHMMLLLFTDATEEWDWCLYEAGFFTGRKVEYQKLVCIHDSSENVPDQIKNFQTLPATEPRVKGFLYNLYVDTVSTWGFSRPLARHVSDNDNELLKTLTSRIVSLLSHEPIRVQPYGKHIQIDVLQSALVKGGGLIPNESSVSGTGIDLFDLNGTHPWENLKKDTNPDQQKCLDELAGAMGRAAQNKTFPALKSSWHPSGDERNKRAYRPCLYKAEWRRNGFVRFSVFFSEEPSLERDDRVVLSINSFSELMEQLIDLLDSTTEGMIKIVALTPALGFLAKKEDQWHKLEQRIRDNKDRIEITCQEPEDLAKWHAAFEGRRTERGVITQELTRDATSLSEELLGICRRRHRLPWSDMPNYYVLSSNDRAIFVSPFHLPRMDAVVPKEERRGLLNVEMFGSVTNDRIVVDRFGELQEYYFHLPHRDARASATAV